MGVSKFENKSKIGQTPGFYIHMFQYYWGNIPQTPSHLKMCGQFCVMGI